MEKICRNCYWWDEEDDEEYRRCYRAGDSSEIDENITSNTIDDFAAGSCDYGVGAYLETQSNFGCIHFKQRD